MALYSLAETSVTHSHRDYANLYTVTALCVFPDRYTKGVVLGICVHFISSSGWSKVLVGGAEWGLPHTLDSVLKKYQHLKRCQGGPGVPVLTKVLQWSSQRPDE